MMLSRTWKGDSTLSRPEESEALLQKKKMCSHCLQEGDKVIKT